MNRRQDESNRACTNCRGAEEKNKRSAVKKTIICLVVLAGLSGMAACGSSTKKVGEGELSGEITLSGAFALYPLAVKWAEEFRAVHPGVRIDISAGGAGKGITDVLSGVVDLGMVSREVYPAEAEKGAVVFAVAKDAVVATINAENPALEVLLARGLTRESASALWITGEAKNWNDVTGTTGADPVHLYTRSDACGAAETWAGWMDKKQEDLLGTAVFGDPGVAQAVQRDRLGIGFNNLSYAYDEGTRLPNEGLLVLPIDVNGNGAVDDDERFYDTKDAIIAAIAADKYPSPPARDLYLVTGKTPNDPALKAFLKFILTDGQQYNVPSGYISPADDKLQAGLRLLDGGDNGGK